MHMHAHTQTHMHAHTHRYAHTQIHTDTNAHTCAHTHTHLLVSVQLVPFGLLSIDTDSSQLILSRFLIVGNLGVSCFPLTHSSS